MGYSKSHFKREVYSYEYRHLEKRSQINNFKELEKEQIKPKVSREKREIKIRAERNKIEDRKTI